MVRFFMVIVPCSQFLIIIPFSFVRLIYDLITIFFCHFVGFDAFGDGLAKPINSSNLHRSQVHMKRRAWFNFFVSFSFFFVLFLVNNLAPDQKL